MYGYDLRSRQKSSLKDKGAHNKTETDSHSDSENSEDQDEYDSSNQSPEASSKHLFRRISENSLDTSDSDDLPPGSESFGRYSVSPSSKSCQDSGRNLVTTENLKRQKYLKDKNYSSSSSRFAQSPKALQRKGQQNQSMQSCSTISILMLFVCILVLSIALFLLRSFHMESDISTQKKFIIFSKGVDRLREEFPGQDKRFWKTVKASAKHIFDFEDATYPAVLLLACNKNDETLAEHIAAEIAGQFANANPSGRVNKNIDMALNLSSLTNDADDQKLYVDQWLQEYFNSNHSVVVLNHLEALQPQAALLLHGYCDGDNAPYKHVMLILVLSLDQHVASQAEVENALRRLWLPYLSEDKISALLTRMANNALFLQKGY